MIIGCIELPNKWAVGARATGQNFIYHNCSKWPQTNSDTWGGICKVGPDFRCFKIISQMGLRMTEYWCVSIYGDDTMYPIAMKRFGYRNNDAKCFVFQGGISKFMNRNNYDIRNMRFPYCNSFDGQHWSLAEYVLLGLEENEVWPQWSELYRRQIERGEDLISFPSGAKIRLSEVLHRCALIQPYTKANLESIDNAGDLHDIGFINGQDIVNYMLDYTPCDPLCSHLELDYIGECILSRDVEQFQFNDVLGVMMHTPTTRNTMRMLDEESKKEELVDVENFQDLPLADYYSQSILGDDIQQEIEQLISLLCMDEATTQVFEYDYTTCHTTVIERILGYGAASLERNYGDKFLAPADQIGFGLHKLCELVEAQKIRVIKTYNEEMYMTVWFMNGRVCSYYYNLIVHLCVTGNLFTL